MIRFTKQGRTVLSRPSSQLKPGKSSELECVSNDGEATRTWRKLTFRRCLVQPSYEIRSGTEDEEKDGAKSRRVGEEIHRGGEDGVQDFQRPRYGDNI